mmetsp:Transcript_24665/g.52336  ORF Transcript_24665/g.52336 Transcript_24665/m.52336 type:complete len:105 (+) Transcript_24665:1910-2224(+)
MPRLLNPMSGGSSACSFSAAGQMRRTVPHGIDCILSFIWNGVSILNQQQHTALLHLLGCSESWGLNPRSNPSCPRLGRVFAAGRHCNKQLGTLPPALHSSPLEG